MAFDQNSIPKDLRPINISKTASEEPCIVAAATAALGNANAVPVFYPGTVSEAGFVGLGYGNAVTSGVALWNPRVPVQVGRVAPVNPAVGLGYGPNVGSRVVGNGLDQATSDVAAGMAYNPNVVVRVSDGGSDQSSPDSSSGFVSGPNLGNQGSGNGANQVNVDTRMGFGCSPATSSEEGGEDSASGKKVKLLCSFAGKILPRPSDNVLRYVGGQTRIISVRKDVTFNELAEKMVDACGRPVVIKYQLPDEDLDALVSVSCQDDIANMMDEYEKLIGRSPDGSAKLRLFLFSASELDTSGSLHFDNLHDSGQRYVEAVNTTMDATSGSGFTRKESTASATSTQNSDLSCTETVDCSGVLQVDVTSPSNRVVSPKENSLNSQESPPKLVRADPTSTIYTEVSAVPMGTTMVRPGATQILSSHPELQVERSMPLSMQHPLIGSDMHHPSMAIPSLPPYLQAYGDPRLEAMKAYVHSQTGLSNPRMLGPANSVFTQQQAHSNSVGATSHHFVTMIPSSTHVGIRPTVVQPLVQQPQQNLLERYPDEVAYGARVALPVDQRYPTYHNQFPHSVGGGYGWQQTHPHSVLISDGSIPQQQDKEDGATGLMHDTTSFHQNLPQDDHVRAQQANKLMASRPFGEATSEQGVGIQPKILNLLDQPIGMPQSDITSFLQNLEIKQDNIISPKPENPEYPKNGVPQVISGLTAGVQPAHGFYKGLIPQSQQEIITQQNIISTQCLQENGAGVPAMSDHNDHAMRNAVPQGVMGFTGEVQSSFGMCIGGFTPPHHENIVQQRIMPLQCQVKQESIVSKTALPNECQDRHESVVSDAPPTGGIPFQASECIVQESSKENLYKPPGAISSEDLGHVRAIDPNKSPGSELIKENIFDNRPQQCAGREVLLQNAFNLHEALETTHSPNCMNQWSYVQSIRGMQPQDSVEVCSGNLACSGIDTSFLANKGPPISERKEDTLQSQPNMAHNELEFGTLNSQPTNINDLQDSSNIVFNNQELWNLQQEAHFPPKPNKIATKVEAGGVEDPFVNVDCMKKQKMLDGGTAPLSKVSKESSPQHASLAKDEGSQEEHIKEELQAVAEGVATSIFHSPTAPNPDSSESDQSDYGHETNQEKGASNANLEIEEKAEVEGNKAKVPEKSNIGFPISNDIGRLQIIKNNDLEELQELGSGTFGTVYHGKWRGTDVAIKRINDRCFAGKPSEQERTRNDFWNEAINLADLHHPNVVAFYGVVLDGPGGSVATVTEYMTNGSLRTVLQKSERGLDKRKRIFIAMDVAFGMEYLHGKNIVHFDLKSDNLLVNLRDPHRPICKVGDLGLSKVKCKTLISGGVRGTLPWMAPELLNGSSSLVSEKVDVFSYGIVMWELLTGEEPYADLHYGAIIGGIVSNTLRPPVPESCEPEWRDLIERCWATEPLERPSFTEVVKELRSMAAKLPNKAQNAPTHSPTT